MIIVISSGHGKYIRGASGYLDEVDEARRVVARVGDLLNAGGNPTKTYNDDISRTQSENLNRIVSYHNSQTRDLDVSVHFNAYMVYDASDKPDGMGSEVLYVTQKDLADRVVNAIVKAGEFINRHAKFRDDLYFLNNTDEPAILIETCFVDSEMDAELYVEHFSAICKAIARAIK